MRAQAQHPHRCAVKYDEIRKQGAVVCGWYVGHSPGMGQNMTGKMVWVQFVKKLEPLEVQVEISKGFSTGEGLDQILV